MPTGHKHLIQCRCFLPQFKRLANPIEHRFPVFSVINDDDEVEPKFVSCPNCGIVHKITEIGRSEIQVGRENASSVVSIQDLSNSLPDKLAAILQSNDADISSWEEAQFIVENQQWGRIIILNSETIGDEVQGKYVKILSENLFKIDTFVRSDIVKEKST